MNEPSAYKVVLPIFEGPLDLLLYLVRRHELDILDIPIAFITEKYLEYLALMRELRLDVAAEYLLMAATLTYLKSRELLPSPEVAPLDEDEQGDPRAELIRRLLDYQRYRDAAERLSERPMLGRDVFARNAAATENEEVADTPLAEVSVFVLLDALGEMLRRAKTRLGEDIVVDRISLVERIQNLTEQLDHETSFTLESCIDWALGEAQIRHLVIVTFLALLEMARLRSIRIHQITPGGPVYISRASAGGNRIHEEATP